MAAAPIRDDATLRRVVVDAALLPMPHTFTCLFTLVVFYASVRCRVSNLRYALTILRPCFYEARYAGVRAMLPLRGVVCCRRVTRALLCAVLR